MCFVLAHGAAMYASMSYVRVFVPLNPLQTRPCVPVHRCTMRICHDTLYVFDTWLIGQFELLSSDTILSKYSLCVLVGLVVI